MTRLVIELCAAVLIACAAYVVGHDHGRQVEQVKRAEAVATTQAAIDARDNAAATVSISTQSYLWATLPPIELRTYEARERVKVLYRDQPVDCVPVRPLGVQAELDATRQRANAAAGQLRSGTDAPASTGAGAR